MEAESLGAVTSLMETLTKRVEERVVAAVNGIGQQKFHRIWHDLNRNFTPVGLYDAVQYDVKQALERFIDERKGMSVEQRMSLNVSIAKFFGKHCGRQKEGKGTQYVSGYKKMCGILRVSKTKIGPWSHFEAWVAYWAICDGHFPIGIVKSFEKRRYYVDVHKDYVKQLLAQTKQCGYR